MVKLRLFIGIFPKSLGRLSYNILALSFRLPSKFKLPITRLYLVLYFRISISYDITTIGPRITIKLVFSRPISFDEFSKILPSNTLKLRLMLVARGTLPSLLDDDILRVYSLIKARLIYTIIILIPRTNSISPIPY